MFIETESTPNPATLKFIPGERVMAEGSADFISPEQAAASPLAAALFAIPGVVRVFFGPDFISVTKSDEASWQSLKPQILGAIVEHYLSGAPLIAGEADVIEEDVAPEDAEIAEAIKELLDTRVRPAVAGDGGDIIFRGYRDGVVKLVMQGACSGCPSSRATLKHGVENLLRHYIPEVRAVEAVEI
jgi:Fe-S cluster biogenesis protein NfuA